MRQTTQTTIAENGIQRNITKAEANGIFATKTELAANKVYDLIIKTQEEFEEFYAQLDAGTFTGHSVLFVGDGGNLQFTRNDGGCLALPPTLTCVDGINNAIIKITVTNETPRYSGVTPSAIIYKSKNEDTQYSMSNLKLILVANVSAYGIALCKNLINVECEASGYSIPAVFYLCINLVNCVGTATNSANTSSYVFVLCKYLINCTATARDGYSRAFNECETLVNCYGRAISNTSAVAFYKCVQLSNCMADGYGINSGTNGICYAGCSYCNGCKIYSRTSGQTSWTGTNTKRDDDSCDL